jgi:hypothetical protein
VKLQLALAVLLGCAESSTATVVEIPPSNVSVVQPLPPKAQPPGPPIPQGRGFRAGQSWEGTYVCAQGPSRVMLRIGRVDGGIIDAVFEFAVPQQRVVGSYQVRGEVDEDGSTVAFSPGRWIDQPPNYIPVGFRGTLSDATFAGRMDHASCGRITLQRQ